MAQQSEPELIVLLDEHHKPIGSAPKLDSHHADTPLHLAFSCYVFNSKGQLLITRRAHAKKVWPDVWTNSFCGHPAPDESFDDAIKRRATFELGLTGLENLTNIIADYQYKTTPYNDIIENEFCPIFACKVSAEPEINPDEVAAYEWVDYGELHERIAKHPDIFSYWFKEQLALLPHDMFSHVQ